MFNKKRSSSVHTMYKITTLHISCRDLRIAKYKQPLTTQLKKSHPKTILKAYNVIPGWMVAKQIQSTT
jgi:hypothetical protein